MGCVHGNAGSWTRCWSNFGGQSHTLQILYSDQWAAPRFSEMGLEKANSCNILIGVIPDLISCLTWSLWAGLGNKELSHVEDTCIWILTWISYFTSDSRNYFLWLLTKNSVSGVQELKAKRFYFSHSFFPILLKAKSWWAADSPAELKPLSEASPLFQTGEAWQFCKGRKSNYITHVLI